MEVDREEHRKSRRPWSYLLKRYQKARRHAEGLFKAVIGGSCWRCQCKEQHCVHLQLQTNPLQDIDEYSHCEVDGNSQFRMVFSNTNNAGPTCLWTWAEVVFEPWQLKESITAASNPLHDDSKSYRRKKPKVQFDMSLAEEARLSKPNHDALSAPLIQDFCSYLRVAESHVGRRDSMGSIPNELDASVRYTMHAVKILPKPIPQKALSEVLSHITRRDRLYIAAGLACGVIQFCGNWLKPWWDSSDVHLAAAGDGAKVLLDTMYLSWALSATGANQGHLGDAMYARFGNHRLFPLGLALVELSTGKSLHMLLELKDEDQDTLMTKLQSVSWLVKRVFEESGENFANAVDSCLSWSALCVERSFEERVFDNIISPLLKDLVHFEGKAKYQ